MFKIVPLQNFISTHPTTSLQDVENSLRLIFKTYIAAFKISGIDKDQMKFIIDQEYFNIPIVIKSKTLDSISVKNIMNKVSDVLQSKKEIRVDRTSVIEADILWDMGGGSNKMRSLLDTESDSIYSKCCIICIKNGTDNTCLHEAILVSWTSGSQIDSNKLHALASPDDRSIPEMILHVRKTCDL